MNIIVIIINFDITIIIIIIVIIIIILTPAEATQLAAAREKLALERETGTALEGQLTDAGKTIQDACALAHARCCACGMLQRTHIKCQH